jgi:hypothetical protein
MRHVLAALALILATHSAAAQACLPAAAVMAMVQGHPAYASHHVASAEEARTAADIFNAAPPESDVPWTLAILVSFRDGSGGLLVGTDREICGSLGFAPAHWPAVVRAVRGAGA